MATFTLVWHQLLDSSVWLASSKETRLVWVTLLLMKDAEGVVRASVPGIAHRAVVSLEECRRALKQLSEADPDTLTQEHQGRRIKRVENGWLILNHEKYRTSENMRDKWRRQKAAQRARKGVGVSPKYKAEEAAYEKAFERGDEAECDRIAGEGL